MKTKIYHALSFLMGALMINGGLNKIFNYMPTPTDLPEAMMKDMMALMEIEWLMPLIAVAEIVGGILIIIPKTRALGSLVLFPIMVGILLTHIFVATSGLPIALALWGILIWILIENTKKLLTLLNS